MALRLFALALSLAAPLASAIPLASTAPTLLSASAISAFTPFSYYATAAYCTPASLLAWNCGTNCQANPGFVPVAAGGNGNSVQYWYVGYDPTYKAVIVGHEGTNTSNLLPILEDGDIIKTTLSSSLFPGISSSIKVDSGFAIAQALTASAVLAAVQKTQATYGATLVITVGHSLGAAIALLDAVYLPLHLPSTTTFKSYLYGLPRVGNPAFAAFVDSAASRTSVTHVNNMKDPVPILPGRFLGFAHPAGEVHIQAPGQWYSCPGEDNTASTCEVGDVSNIFVSHEDDHDGPYGAVEMGSATCNLNQ